MNHNHGVDVSDVTRDFTSDKWSRLHEAGMISYIRNQHNYTNSGGQRQVAAVGTLPLPTILRHWPHQLLHQYQPHLGAGTRTEAVSVMANTTAADFLPAFCIASGGNL
jgi:hypothetical protein